MLLSPLLLSSVINTFMHSLFNSLFSPNILSLFPKGPMSLSVGYATNFAHPHAHAAILEHAVKKLKSNSCGTDLAQVIVAVNEKLTFL